MAAVITMCDSEGVVLLPMRWYSQASEPVLANVKDTCIWIDTSVTPNNVFYIYKRAAADQVKMELTATGTDKIKTVTNTYPLVSTDGTVVCNKATAFVLTVYLATGSGRKHVIPNINTGIVSLTASGSDYFNLPGTTVVPINQGESATIIDVAAGIWFVVA